MLSFFRAVDRNVPDQDIAFSKKTRRRNRMAQGSKSNKVVVEKIEVPGGRKHFKNLMLANPNYFGTFPNFGGKVIKAFSGNTAYEQLTCLGLNPGGLFGGGLLEAVINIKQHS